MTTADTKAEFIAIVEHAIKSMQHAVTTASSTAYEVHRSSGEMIVQRSDNAWEVNTPKSAPLEKKKAA